MRVELADGIYRLESTWSFGAADSGSSGHPVVWTAASGAYPIISGATQVASWTRSGTGGMWASPVPAGSNSRQLYVNGAEAPVAQQTPDQLGFSGGWTGSANGYSIKNDGIAMTWFNKLSAAQIANVEFVYTQGNGNWTESRCRVASYSNGSITMAQPCWTNVTQRATYSNPSGSLPSMSTGTMPSSIQNALTLIQPGQWFLDAADSTLYYQPITGQVATALDVELPRLETLLQGAGSLVHPLHDVTFSGLQFSYATWNAPSAAAGFADVQSNLRMTTATGNQGMCLFSSPPGSCPWGALSQPLANVSFSASNNVTFERNRFTALGGAGLAFMYGSSGNLVENNEFATIASAAIIMGCTFDPTPTDGNVATAVAIRQNCNPDPTLVKNDVIGANEIMMNNTIKRNLIHNIGTDYPSASAITLLFGQKTSVTHNEIHDVPYTAITAGIIQGHVDNSSHPSLSVNINDSNMIGNNLLHDYMTGLTDGGAVYIEGHQALSRHLADGKTIDPVDTLAHGIHVTGNVSYNSNNVMRTYYDDAGSEWINWADNVSFNSIGPYGTVQGGCEPTGHIWYTNNYADAPGGDYSTCSPSPIDTHDSSNVTITSMSDVPATLLSHAGRGTDARNISESNVMGRLGDNASQLKYTGSWQHANNRSGYYDYLRDLHYTTSDGDTMMVDFTGTAIQVFGEQNTDQGKLGISIDGRAQQIVDTVPIDQHRHSNVAIYTSPMLSRGSHTLTVTKLSGTYATMNGVYILP
ncbi:right-handed parallel beta-helix repeat-containing protein [Burkholderia sp. Bp8986]|uniref:right-handed parallel beta-helix repeat-containing protein n=1 Tax=Burkholderia sp. Bp8986 TaxID=2184550 RepID=UPI000F5B4EA4|nr:right-handed parallel beta-helix repeat-containing protein [Burkholderia sp. Bp8986]